MRNSFTLTLAFIVPAFVSAQITITNNDMVDAGDSVRYSYAASIGSADQTLTDTNYVWDYSFLTPVAQERVEYFAPTAFPMNFLSDMAVTNYTPDSLPFIGQLPSNFTDYYKGTSSSFRQVGITFDIPNFTSFSAPIIFSAADYVYRFPVNYGNVDSCDAAYSFNIPGLGYLGQDRHRVNYVDGWGTLYLPTDTFQVLRIRSVVDITDTVSFDSTNQTGYSIARPTEIQYKWLAPGKKLPVLEIDCQILFNAEVVTNIMYQDTLRDSLWQVAIPGPDLTANFVSVYPNPASDQIVVEYGQQDRGDLDIVITDMTGKQVQSHHVEQAGAHGYLPVNVADLNAGIYLISVVTSSGKSVSKIVID